jgi:hypothetical protein
MTMEDERKREKMIEQHHKIGKSFKNDMHKWEKELEIIEQ